MLEKEFLEEEYVNKLKPMHQIAKENNIAIGTVYNYIKSYGIVSRPIMTQETKQKISKAKMGKTSPRKGVKLSKETKLKISEGHKGKFRNPSEFGGYRRQRKDGYVCVFCPNHPYATKNESEVMEHRLIMEKHIGRFLDQDEVVHHKNHIRNDNRIENLQLMSFKEHAALHMKERNEKKKERNDDLLIK